MSWWNRASDARLLLTIVIDDPFTLARHTYTEAMRRIERGNIEAFAETGRCVSIYLVSGTHFVTPEPTPLWGNLLPRNLDRDIRSSADGRLTDVGLCTHPGCDQQLTIGRRLYCDAHAESSARDKARLRQRRKRCRRPPYSPS